MLLLILIVSLARTLLLANLPLTLIAGARHDDGLFINLAMQLASGHWLGHYDQLTLMKGPGYPLFLAVASYTSLPVSIAHGLFQVLAFCAATWIVLRLTSSYLLAAATFLLLALMPIGFHADVQRVVRDQIYWGQTLILFSLFAAMFFAPPHVRTRNLVLAVAAGSVLGWAWLTREEGIWFLPGLALLLAGAVALGRHDRQALVGIGQSTIAATAAFLLVNAAFATGNKIAYGSFVGVDFKESGFAAAVGALNSVEVGAPPPYVPVPLAVRTEVAKVSPTFAQLEPDLRTGNTHARWTRFGCSQYPSSCGDYAGGWFVWALRDVAAVHGFYRSPQTASRNFRQIADDIRAACSDGRLKCRSTALSFVPHMTTDQLLHTLPTSIADVIGKTALWNMRSLRYFASAPDLPLPRFANAWSFLNFPLISNGNVARELIVTGWYLDSADQAWPTFKGYTRSGSALSELVITRRPSPDLQKHYEAARLNRFQIAIACQNGCTIAAERDGKPALRVEPREGRRTRVKSDTAMLVIESAIKRNDLRALPRHRAAIYLRAGLVDSYRFVMPAFLAVGLLATFVTLGLALFARTLPPATWMIAVAAWSMVAARIFILALIDTSSFNAANLIYVAPASYLAALASLLAIAALVQRDWYQAVPIGARSGDKEAN